MFVGPVQGHGATALQNNNEQLAGGGQGFKQFLLRCGQVEAGAISAVETVDLDLHLFAFKLRREAYKGDHHIGLPGASHGLVKLRLGWRLPLEGEAAAGPIACV